MIQSRNVDAHEIAKFERIAQQWWDPSGTMRTLQTINPLRISFVSTHAQIQGARIADIGCGGGILSEALARAGAKVVGIDQSVQAIEVARHHAAGQGLAIDYRLQTVEELAQTEGGTFDYLTCMELLEHVPDPGAIVAASACLLKPKGLAFFATINRTVKAWFYTVIGGEYILRLLPRGSHSYARLIRPTELQTWAKASGFEFVCSTSLMYNLWTQRFWLKPGTEDVNYMMCFTKKAGA